MTEIPEHLRKRAEEARAEGRSRVGRAAATAAADEQSPEQAAAASKIPAHLLERSKAAKAQKAGGDDAPAGGGGTAVATAPAAAAVATSDGGPLPTGPGGHTQRLLTVVKSGSIQDVKATPLDKVHVWPHLLVVEFVAALAITAFTADLLDLRERPAARAGQLQPDAEPVQGAVVLPRPPGTAHHVPPDGGRRDHPGHGHLRPHPGPLHRPQPVQQARTTASSPSRCSPSS